MVPGITRKRRTRAALALEDTKGELEDGEKVVSGERRSHEAIEAGSWPREELLGRGRKVSGRFDAQRSRFWLVFVHLTYLWRSVEILDAWMPTRFPATPLITGWNTAMSGNLGTELYILSNDYNDQPSPRDDAVEDLPAQAGDHHGRQHGAPAVSQDLTGVGVTPGDGGTDLK